jgi:hypothetical protein
MDVPTLEKFVSDSGILGVAAAIIVGAGAFFRKWYSNQAAQQDASAATYEMLSKQNARLDEQRQTASQDAFQWQQKCGIMWSDILALQAVCVAHNIQLPPLKSLSLFKDGANDESTLHTQVDNPG